MWEGWQRLPFESDEGLGSLGHRRMLPTERDRATVHDPSVKIGDLASAHSIQEREIGMKKGESKRREIGRKMRFGPDKLHP